MAIISDGPGALTAAEFGKKLVPLSDCRALEAQIRDIHRLRGEKVIENQLLREAVSRAVSPRGPRVGPIEPTVSRQQLGSIAGWATGTLAHRLTNVVTANARPLPMQLCAGNLSLCYIR